MRLHAACLLAFARWVPIQSEAEGGHKVAEAMASPEGSSPPERSGILWRSSAKTAPGLLSLLRSPEPFLNRRSQRESVREGGTTTSRLSARLSGVGEALSKKLALKISSPKRRKLSTRAALELAKREAVDAAGSVHGASVRCLCRVSGTMVCVMYWTGLKCSL